MYRHSAWKVAPRLTMRDVATPRAPSSVITTTLHALLLKETITNLLLVIDY
jgi:hypothetical protein